MKNINQIIEFNTIEDCIEYMQEVDRKKLGLSKKEFALKCSVYNCKYPAEVYIETSAWQKIKRAMKFEFNYDGAKYCKKHIKEMCKNLKLKKEDFKEITNNGI